jgi:hypothetical protein
VLGAELQEVVRLTAEAVEVVRLTQLEDPRVRALAASSDGGASVLVGEDYGVVELAPRFVLSSEADQISAALGANPPARWLIVRGALPEAFLRGLLRARRGHQGELVLVVADSTHVFLSERGPQWYARQGLAIQTLDSIALEAITVNPLAPQSHSFDSAQLRDALGEEIEDVPIFDVLHPDYLSAERAARSA